MSREFDILCSHKSNVFDKFLTTNPIFVCVISYTETCQVPGITFAGANPDLIKYTPAADAEFLFHGRCFSISGVPATPDGIPTPALLTRTALLLGKIPCLVVNSGSKIDPKIPFISFGISHGKNIEHEAALQLFETHQAFDYGNVLGKQLSKSNDLVVLGESIPGGTTTALGVLTGFGIDANYKISSSMPSNPHDLKIRIVQEAIKNYSISDLKDPFKTVSLFGDPMIPAVAGIATGLLQSGSRVMLAGGTQMAAVLAFMASLNVPFDKICIGTTSYVTNDENSDLDFLVKAISPDIPILSVNPGLDRSTKNGLLMYDKGVVKEGVGSGGAIITLLLKLNRSLDKDIFLRKLEDEYEKNIENIVV
ncbi:MAG TPA: TIGR00303 family protein [Nitrososphaeraceae archaeon]|nr:TIGR00303 family protein [Nitrososphaeraceae archaeon]